MLTLVLLLRFEEIFSVLGDLTNPSVAVGDVIAATSILEHTFLCLMWTRGFIAVVAVGLKSEFYDLFDIVPRVGLLRPVI